MNILKMLGVDSAQLQSFVAQLVESAKNIEREQQRIAEFQNLLAQNAIRTNAQLRTVLTALGETPQPQIESNGHDEHV
jgi:hypothetical protein